MRCVEATLLKVIIVFQWLLLVSILYFHQSDLSYVSQAKQGEYDFFSTIGKRERTLESVEWKGVAATLALRSPKWFHRRYTSMMYNVIENTPNDWAVQIFVQPQWWNKEILTLHRGMHKVLKHPRVIVTELPETFWKFKPKQILIQSWFWDKMVADQIFLFSGNGVMCSHTLATMHTFKGLDFCGVPSKHIGGDGSTHSIRSRKAMLDAITYGNPKMNIDSESAFFSSTLSKLNDQTPGRYRIASKNESILFGGAAELISGKDELLLDFENYGPSMVVSGTGAKLSWKVRESILQICPEWKLIFPSLHDPNCFGSNPVANKCAESICALKPDRPKQGC